MNGKRTPEPPRLGRWLLERTCPPFLHEEVRGDLDELYRRRRESHSKWKADLLYTWEALISVRLQSLARKSPSYTYPKDHLAMFKNYLKVALRNFRSHKMFTVVNMGGLAVGFACCLMIYVFVDNEYSYDTFHENAGDIYRVVFSTSDDGAPSNANGSFGVAPALMEDYPSVTAFTRFFKGGQQGTQSMIRQGDDIYYEKRFFFADSSLFDVFSFPLTAGNPATALSRSNTILLTESTARKYFPNENPVGQTLTADPFGEGNWLEFEVTGVLEDLPRNSHIHFDFLASIYTIEPNQDLSQFAGFQQVYSYIRLREGGSEEALEATFEDFIHRNWTDDPWYSIQIQPMLDIHLQSHLRSEIEPNGNITYVYIFSAIAVFVLLIACINFVNLVTARSTTRAKEVGLRKTVGAGRFQLVRQFLVESVLISLGAGLLALLLAYLLTPVFNGITGRELDILSYPDPLAWLAFGGLVVIVGVMAGIYPAFMLSGFNPVHTLKGYLKGGSRSGTGLRKGLVVVQFCISMALIASTAIVFKQLNFIQTGDLGYADDQIMVLPLNNEVRSGYDAMRGRLLQQSGVENTTTSSLVPTRGSSHNGFQVEGVQDEQTWATWYVDEHFTDTYGLRMLAGEDVRRSLLDESGGDFLLTENAVSEAGLDTLEQVVGRSITWNGEYNGRVTGVVNDMHIYSFREEIYASAFFITPIQYHKYLSVRVRPENVSATLDGIRQVWNEMAPGYPFDYFFLDESFAEMHRSDTRLAETITWFALLAIFIACLGLFGLSSFIARQRMKEIGIRKVLGASVGSIVGLFSKDFLKLALVGAVVAVPIAWKLMDNWLQEFIYRIDMGVLPFLAAAAALGLIALATIGYTTVSAARRNPVESLQSE